MSNLLIVTGQPRSGTSLMMRILHDSGLPVVADEKHSYECAATVNLQRDNKWVLELPDGVAMKVLYPHVMYLPSTISYRMIWMHRNPREQAKSQRKFGGHSRQWVAPRIKYIVKVELAVPQSLHKMGNDVLRVSFDDILRTHDLEELALWLRNPVEAGAIASRSPKSSGLPVGTLEVAV